MAPYENPQPKDSGEDLPSFASRGPLAGSLGSFELPPVPIKYPYTEQSPASHTSQASTITEGVRNLLTPPSTMRFNAITPAENDSSTSTPEGRPKLPTDIYNPPPVFSNVQNPSGGLALVGRLPGMMLGFNSGHAAAMPHFLGHPPHQQPTTNDRPFKCDQCPQSFNRNHDLKRHKRIHIAVKPFPCAHCDKSFSRRDALKVCYPVEHKSYID